MNRVCVVVGGNVSCTGANNYTTLGGAITNAQTNAPVQIPGVAGVASVAIGTSHVCALQTAGRIHCWGSGGSGQLGTGPLPYGYGGAPAPVSNISSAIALVAGDVHGCALVAGTVQCWGGNAQGQIGDGTTTNQGLSVQAQGLMGVTAIAAGTHHTCACRVGRGAVLGRQRLGTARRRHVGDGTLASRDRPAGEEAFGRGAACRRTRRNELESGDADVQAISESERRSALRIKQFVVWAHIQNACLAPQGVDDARRAT